MPPLPHLSSIKGYKHNPKEDDQRTAEILLTFFPKYNTDAVALSVTRKDGLIGRSGTSEPGNVSSEKTQSRAAQRVKQLPKCQGRTASESRKDFQTEWLVKRSAAVLLESVPFGTAVLGSECSIQERDFIANEKFKIIFFAWISNYSPAGVRYFKQRHAPTIYPRIYF